MRAAVQYVSWLLWFPLELLVIAALLRGAFRRYPAIFVYSLAVFLTSVVETAAYIGWFSGERLTFTRAQYYWLDEGIRQVLLFIVVISLLYQATSNIRTRAVVRMSLILGAILIATISFLVHYDSHIVIGRWMTRWTRDLNFSSAILDLSLWGILLNSRNYDEELLMLSGALGIQFAGEAIGQTLRNQFPSILLAADTTIVVANLACLYIWWQVFRASPVRKASHTAPLI
jgi:hypothetical protein